METVAIWVDAFTSAPFAGNPAVVVLLDRLGDETWMQALAREMGVSETAFVVPRSGGRAPADGFDLRWFTPAVEVDFCGHATLASAHALWEEERVARGAPIRFHTRSGVLGARVRDDWIELDFPAAPAVDEPAPAELVEALSVKPSWTGRTTLGDWLIEIGDEERVRSLAPDMARVGRAAPHGVIVTARASGDYDFVSRFFAPALGIDEDPVTGAAHCALAGFWAERLRKNEMVGYQASARGGVVRVRAEGERVILGGQAVTVLRGELWNLR
jgi:PhzF family phenazine biosynthesis protein